MLIGQDDKFQNNSIDTIELICKQLNLIDVAPRLFGTVGEAELVLASSLSIWEVFSTDGKSNDNWIISFRKLAKAMHWRPFVRSRNFVSAERSIELAEAVECFCLTVLTRLWRRNTRENAAASLLRNLIVEGWMQWVGIFFSDSAKVVQIFCR